jgi:hypothetical protein
MAKKKTTTSTAAVSKPKAAKSANVRIVVDIPDGSEPYYANHVEVGCSKYDFFLLFARMPTKLPPAVVQAVLDTGEIHVPSTVQVVVPASIVAGLIRALEIQKAKYEKDNGEIPDLGANAPKPGKPNDKPPAKTH